MGVAIGFRRRVLYSMIAIGMFVAACSDEPEAKAPFAMLDFTPFEGELAGLEGQLVIEGDCVFVESDDGLLTAVLLPVGYTSWDEAPGVLTVSGREMRDGDLVIAIGGEFGEQPELPDRCDGDSTPFVGGLVPAS